MPMPNGPSRESRTDAPFQILSLSGGGYLGLYSARILAELEEALGGRPLHTCFDLIAGTSVGGIIALGIAAGVPARSIADAFGERGEAIFSGRSAPKSALALLCDVARTLSGPKYTGVALRETVAALVGDLTLGDLRRPCLIPAVNLTKGGPQIFKTPHHSDFSRDLRLKVVDVAMATSAAPTFFPVASIGDELFADGGMFANSPDHVALHEAEHFFQVACQRVRLLSIGTTTSKFSFSHSAGTKLGLFGWVKGQRLVQAMLASQQQITDAMLRHRLGGRYLRLDTTQSPEQVRDLALDVAHEDARRTIGGLAESTIRTAINDPLLRTMLDHEAPPSVFFHRTLTGAV
jgi:patatin-like phospholipase/acyl hydrolase